MACVSWLKIYAEMSSMKGRSQQSSNLLIHTYMHTYIHAYIHTCIHSYMHMYIHTHACMLTCIHINTYINISTNISTLNYTLEGTTYSRRGSGCSSALRASKLRLSIMAMCQYIWHVCTCSSTRNVNFCVFI